MGGSKADTRKWSKNVGIYFYEDEKEKTPGHENTYKINLTSDGYTVNKAFQYSRPHSRDVTYQTLPGREQ